ncbi:MAG TPA: MDR family MFS transporter [Dehalococcoidia bacterium]|nr:MDR family MFS transporter [Dehalococcoidia bacterium]
MTRRELDPRITVAAVYVAAQFMSAMDSTVVNVALPTLGNRFHVTGASIDGVIIGYLISLAVFIPASGWLGDRFGTKRVFLCALLIFSLASALCGQAQSFGELVAFRTLQGAGGGMLTPVGMAMLFRTFPPEQRVRASRILVVPGIIAPASGPVLGGLIVDKLSWRWAFYVNVPVGCAALLFGLLFLREHREHAAGRFDLPGFLLAGTGFPLLMYAVTEGPSRGWDSAAVLVSAGAGLLLLAAFVRMELRTAAPMVQLRLFANRLFQSCTTTSMTASAAFLGVLFVTPLFLQEARGDSALESGLTTFPEAIGVLLSMQLVARVYPYVGPRRLMAAGMLWVAAMMTLLSFIGLETSAWLIRLLMFAVGTGMAFVFLPNQAAGFATVTPSQMGRASTLFNAQRQLGAATGVALLSSVLAIAGPLRHDAAGAAHPHAGAYHAAYLAAAALALLAALLALRVPDRDAAATMRHPAGADQPAPPASEPLLAE